MDPPERIWPGFIELLLVSRQGSTLTEALSVRQSAEVKPGLPIQGRQRMWALAGKHQRVAPQVRQSPPLVADWSALPGSTQGEHNSLHVTLALLHLPGSTSQEPRNSTGSDSRISGFQVCLLLPKQWPDRQPAHVPEPQSPLLCYKTQSRYV